MSNGPSQNSPDLGLEVRREQRRQEREEIARAMRHPALADAGRPMGIDQRSLGGSAGQHEAIAPQENGAQELAGASEFGIGLGRVEMSSFALPQGNGHQAQDFNGIGQDNEGSANTTSARMG
jgi:hypothetical protein